MNSDNKNRTKPSEHPKSHLLQGVLLLMFFTILILDFFILRITVGFSALVPLLIRIALFLIVFTLGAGLNWTTHSVLFGEKQGSGENHGPSALVTDGVFACVRHPMYLSDFLIYLSFILLTMSLVSLIPWVIIIIGYNFLANYEEKELERVFGAEYLEYKKRVSKWIPRLI